MGCVTRKDIAREADVTETIVSYVMNGNRYVDKNKRARVMDAVKKFGYVPSPVARALKGKTSDHILFIADDLTSEHFGTIISEMDKRASENGLLVSLVSDRGDPNFVSRVVNWTFDGIVIGSCAISNEDIQTLIDTGTPVVLLAINRYPRFKGNYGLINTGLRRGAQEVVRRFYEAGRTKIAYVCCNDKPEGLNQNDYRYIGYMDELKGQRLVIDSPYDAELMKKKVEQTYLREGFDALLARTDNTALAAISALRGLGARVPEDVAVVGFNDSKICSCTSPTLASVRIKREEIARFALSLLAALQKGGSQGAIAAELDTEVVERESFGRESLRREGLGRESLRNSKSNSSDSIGGL